MTKHLVPHWYDQVHAISPCQTLIKTLTTELIYDSNVVKTVANAIQHDQSSKQTGNQPNNDAIFPVQSATLQIPALLHCNYT